MLKRRESEFLLFSYAQGKSCSGSVAVSKMLSQCVIIIQPDRCKYWPSWCWLTMRWQAVGKVWQAKYGPCTGMNRCSARGKGGGGTRFGKMLW